MHSRRIAKAPSILTLLAGVCWAQESKKDSLKVLEFDSKEAKAERLAYALGHAKALSGTRNNPTGMGTECTDDM